MIKYQDSGIVTSKLMTPSSDFEVISSGTEIDYSNGPAPKAIVANGTGTLVCNNRSGASQSIPMVASQMMAIRPTFISSSTDISITVIH